MIFVLDMLIYDIRKFEEYKKLREKPKFIYSIQIVSMYFVKKK